jgi:hypothetical protein
MRIVSMLPLTKKTYRVDVGLGARIQKAFEICKSFVLFTKGHSDIQRLLDCIGVPGPYMKSRKRI